MLSCNLLREAQQEVHICQRVASNRGSMGPESALPGSTECAPVFYDVLVSVCMWQSDMQAIQGNLSLAKASEPPIPKACFLGSKKHPINDRLLLEVCCWLRPGSRRTAESKRHTVSASHVPEGSQHVAVQTDLHSPAAAFDPAYEWNLWSIRRRAVALTNLRHKATRSAQTETSRFRRNTATQVRLAKDQTQMM